MNAWWSGLERREQLILLAGTALALVVLVYVAVFEPLHQKNALLRSQLNARESVLVELQEIQAQAQSLRKKSAGSAKSLPAGQNIMAVVNASASRKGLLDYISRTVPEAGNRLRLQLDQVPFDELISWLDVLDREHGIQVHSASTSRLEPGLVRAELALSAP